MIQFCNPEISSIVDFIKGESEILLHVPRKQDIIEAWKELRHKEEMDAAINHHSTTFQNSSVSQQVVHLPTFTQDHDGVVTTEPETSSCAAATPVAFMSLEDETSLPKEKRHTVDMTATPTMKRNTIHNNITPDSIFDDKNSQVMTSVPSTTTLPVVHRPPPMVEIFTSSQSPSVDMQSYTPSFFEMTPPSALDNRWEEKRSHGPKTITFPNFMSFTPNSNLNTTMHSSTSAGSHSTGQILRLVDLKETPERVRTFLLHSKKGSNYEVESNTWKNPEALLDFQAAGFTLEEQLILKRRLKLQKLARSYHADAMMT